jgi:hypothetical protein
LSSYTFKRGEEIVQTPAREAHMIAHAAATKPLDASITFSMHPAIERSFDLGLR